MLGDYGSDSDSDATEPPAAAAAADDHRPPSDALRVAEPTAATSAERPGIEAGPGHDRQPTRSHHDAQTGEQIQDDEPEELDFE